VKQNIVLCLFCFSFISVINNGIRIWFHSIEGSSCSVPQVQSHLHDGNFNSHRPHVEQFTVTLKIENWPNSEDCGKLIIPTVWDDSASATFCFYCTMYTYLFTAWTSAEARCIPREMYSTQGGFRFSVTNTSPSAVVTIRMWSTADSGLGNLNMMFLRAALADQVHTSNKR